MGLVASSNQSRSEVDLDIAQISWQILVCLGSSGSQQFTMVFRCGFTVSLKGQTVTHLADTLVVLRRRGLRIRNLSQTH